MKVWCESYAVVEPAKLRLFVALEIDDAVRALASSAVRQLAEAGVVGRFERPEKLHITVAFLGGVPEMNVASVLKVLRDASAWCKPFDLCFTRIGAYPAVGRPRVLWIGPAQESAVFTDCAARVRQAYARLGFTFDHDASSHVTLCRPKFVPPGSLPVLSGSATTRVRGLALMRSLPAGQTTRYEALERTKFKEPM